MQTIKFISRSHLNKCLKRSFHKTKSLLFCKPQLGSETEQKLSTDNLYKVLSSRIKFNGPISVADYMETVLTHPVSGYYMNRDVFGQKGDFTTSPEISQLFGEIVAAWIIESWRSISQNPFNLVELGPGRGTLSKTILRVFRQFKILDKMSLHLVEVSPTLSEIQAKLLCQSYTDIENEAGVYRRGVTADGVTVQWYRNVYDIPKTFSIFLAHEFFDALPIHKFQKTDKGWFEMMIDVDPASNNNNFRYVLAKTPASTAYIGLDEKRDHVEISPQTIAIVDYMSTFLRENGGFSLIIDYGHEGDKTDTFRAYRQHQQCDPLLDPGSADLTADVDFSKIIETATSRNRTITFGPVTQRDFLIQLGINYRLQRLLTSATHDQRKSVQSGYDMIIKDDQMGARFKILSIFPAVLKFLYDKKPVPGFQPQNE